VCRRWLSFWSQQSGGQPNTGRHHLRKAAVDTIVDVELIALAKLNLNHKRARLGNQCAPRLTHDDAVAAQPQWLETGFDLGEERFQGRRVDANIVGWETTPDIQVMNIDTRAVENFTNDRESGPVSAGSHTL